MHILSICESLPSKLRIHTYADDVVRVVGFFCRCCDGFLSGRTSSPAGFISLLSSSHPLCKNPGSSPLFPRVELQLFHFPTTLLSGILCIWGIETWFEFNENVIFIFKLFHSYGIVLWVLHTFMEAFMKIRGGGGVANDSSCSQSPTSSTLCVERQRNTFTYAHSNLIWRG